MLSDQTAIATAAQAIGLAENRLPSVFTLAQTWRQRLQSEVEAGAALTTLVLRIDLSDSGIRLALKVPIVDGGVQPVVNATELIIQCDVPMQISGVVSKCVWSSKAIARRHESNWHC